MVDLKASIRIEEQFAKSCPPINLPALRCDFVDLEQWSTKANSLIQLCDVLLAAPSNVFWSSIALRPRLLEDFDRALKFLPFFSDLQEGGLLHRIAIAPTVLELYAKIWIIFLRICVLYESEGVSPQIFRHLVTQNRILTLRRFRLYSGLYGANYFVCFKKIVGRLRQHVPELFDQFTDEMTSFVESINNLHSSIALMNAKASGGDVRRFDPIFDFFDELQKHIRSAASWNELFHCLSDLRPSKDLLNAIPSLLEDLSESFGDQVLINLAAGSQQLLTGLCRSVNRLKQTFTMLYIRFYNNYADEFDKLELLIGLVDCPELLVRMADKLTDQLGTLLERSKLNDLAARIRRAIDKAYVTKAREIIDNLHYHGLLQNLGVFTNPEIEENVRDLTHMLPYSEEFIHLAFRFYGYDHMTALDRLLNPSTLPFQLRILTKDTSLLQGTESSQRGVLNVDDIYRDSDLESDVEEEAATKDSKVDANNLVALLTAAPNSTPGDNKPALSAKELRMQRTEERLRKLAAKSSDTMNMVQLQYIMEKLHKEEERKTEKPVEIEGRKFTKFYRDDNTEIAKEDKEILRKKIGTLQYEDEEPEEEYARFKMEKQFQEDYGHTGRFNRGYNPTGEMYNDEYEDTFDEPAYGLGAEMTADERGANDQSSYVKPLGPLGVPKNFVYDNQITKGRPPKRSQKYPQQPVTEQPSTSGTQAPKKPPGLTQPPSNKPPPGLTQQPSSNRVFPQQKAANNKKQPQQQKPDANKKPAQKAQRNQSKEKDAADDGAQKQQKASGGGYTGGWSRLQKERHKGQNKQRGADRKMQRANPF